MASKLRSRKLVLILAFLLIDSYSYRTIVNLLHEIDYMQRSRSFNLQEENFPANEIASLETEHPTMSHAPVLVHSSQSEGITDGIVWVMDKEKMECLGLYGFAGCGELSMWYLKTIPTLNGIELQSFHSWYDDNDIQEEQIETSETFTEMFDELTETTKLSNSVQYVQCLGRSRLNNGLSMQSCHHHYNYNKLFSRSLWSYDSELGKLASTGHISNLLGELCVVNNRNISNVLMYCDEMYTPLTILRLSRNDLNVEYNKDDLDHHRITDTQKTKLINNHITTNSTDSLIDYGEYVCPKTGLLIPRNLDSHLGNDIHSRQVLMGSGLFTKVLS